MRAKRGAAGKNHQKQKERPDGVIRVPKKEKYVEKSEEGSMYHRS